MLFSALLIFTLQKGEAEAKEVDWAAINPEMSDATYVKDVNKCFECHEDYIQVFDRTKHGRAFKTGDRNELEARVCEACHGVLKVPGSSTVKSTRMVLRSSATR